MSTKYELTTETWVIALGILAVGWLAATWVVS